MTARCSCGARFKTTGRLRNHLKDTGHEPPNWFKKDHDRREARLQEMRVTEGECDICGTSPVVVSTGLCKTCTTGAV